MPREREAETGRGGRPPLLVSATLRRLVREGSRPAVSPAVEAAVGALREELGEAFLGLVFYGSQLNSTAGPGSDHDFFVVVESYGRAHRRRIDALLNRVLPPSIYRRSFPLARGGETRCKLCFVSAGDLVRATSPEARDSYFFGRLGKRVALVFWRDEESRGMIESSLVRSAALCGGWALQGMEGLFSPEAFLQAALALSYRAEERVEGPARATRLFSADEAYFRGVYGAVLEEARARGLVTPAREPGMLATAAGTAGSRAARRAHARLLRRSRVRARLRWLKNLWTFEGWTDYMIAKIERHQGVSIELTPWERRHPLIAAGKYYLRFRREGRLH